MSSSKKNNKNVYELALERLDIIFKEFDTICVSFSGGKDSGLLLNLCIDYIRKHQLNRKLCVFHMDYEIQYKHTVDYVDRVLASNRDILEVYRVCVPFRVSTCTSMYQSYWRPWQDDLKDYIVHTRYENLDLIPSSTLMSSIEYELFTKWQREYILKKGLKSILESGAYDYVLIDAPPTLGGWVMNILCASDEIIIPVEASPWGLFGLGNMFEFLGKVKEIAPDLKLGGIVITKVDTRKNYFKQTLETLKELDDVKVFNTYIRVDSGVEWSQDNNAPVMAYKKSGRSAKEYMDLTKEIDADA